MPDNNVSSTRSFIVFSDDWGRHPSSCQHLFRQLLPRYTTFWVNTIGMRRPKLDLATLSRGLEKMFHWTRSTSAEKEALPDNLHVSNPRMWPWFRSAFSRRLNRYFLTRHLKKLAKIINGNPTVVTTIPIVADLLEELPEWQWVYYCVDDFGEWPGVDQQTMQVMEKKLIAKCSTIIAVSENLQKRIQDLGRSSELLTHGVDLDHWTQERQPEPLPELHDLERPLLVFWGVVDRRMDVTWVHKLAAKLNKGTIVLVGPKAEPDPELLAPGRIHHVPPMAFSRLPDLAQESSVLIMPYADLPVTRAMQPLKLKEYLATGKPTVVRDLPANVEWADCMDMVSTAENFVEQVLERIDHPLPQGQEEARQRLKDESWQQKALLFEQWATGLQQA